MSSLPDWMIPGADLDRRLEHAGVVVAAAHHGEARCAHAENPRVAVRRQFAFDLAVELQEPQRRDGVEHRDETAADDQPIPALEDRFNGTDA